MGGFPQCEEKWEILPGGIISYQVVNIWGGVILTIQTFFKAKNNIL